MLQIFRSHSILYHSTRSLPFKLKSCKAMSKSACASNAKMTATFAAGCFWGVELAFQRISGILQTTVGYTNGATENPTYQQVCTGQTGHAEAVRIEFDDSIVSYEDLLKVFWDIHDPTTLHRQKNDCGTQYRSGIYYHTDVQRKQAFLSKEEHEKTLSSPIVTEIEEAGHFWPAEEIHQHYLEKGGQCADKGSKTPIRCYG